MTSQKWKKIRENEWLDINQITELIADFEAAEKERDEWKEIATTGKQAESTKVMASVAVSLGAKLARCVEALRYVADKGHYEAHTAGIIDKALKEASDGE